MMKLRSNFGPKNLNFQSRSFQINSKRPPVDLADYRYRTKKEQAVAHGNSNFNTTMNAQLRLFFLLRLFLSCCLLVSSVPSGFIDEDVARVEDGTGSAFVLNQVTNKPMIVVAVKKGLLYAIEDPDEDKPSTKLILNITERVCDNGERGLQAVVPHPNFDEQNNNWIYIFYAALPDNETECFLEDPVRGPRNVVSRMKVGADNMVNVSTEEILLTTIPLVDFNHNGGAMLFGVDQHLYVTLGDGGDHADRYSQQYNTLLGSVLRLTEDGGIPDDNPYVGENTDRCNLGNVLDEGMTCQEIHSIGLRNPFRFAMDMNSKEEVRFLVSDVGANIWEELDEGVMGGNYGWPVREGPCSLGSVDDCELNIPGFEDPLYWYLHRDDGGCVVGGTFVPNDAGWPEEYQGGFLYSDFVFGQILLLQKSDDACPYCLPPVPEWSNTTFHEWERPVDLIFGPYKNETALYYTARKGSKNVRRIRYLGGNNSAPEAVIISNATRGKEPLVVSLDASNSSDSNGDPLSYEWDFGELGSSTNSSVVVTFNESGVYTVSLTVQDSSSFSSSTSIEIHVGTPPVAVMDSPAEGATFAVGDVFTVLGQALDNDGGGELANSTMFWEVRQHHSAHYHPYMGLTRGNNFSLPAAPEPEDFLAATNSHLEILLYVYNQYGLSSVVSRTIMPQTRQLHVTSDPEGLELLIANYPVTTPANVTVWTNDVLTLEARNQSDWTFVGWSDDDDEQAMRLVHVGNASSLVYRANFNGSTTNAPSTTAPSTSPTTTPTCTKYPPTVVCCAVIPSITDPNFVGS